MEPGSDFNGAKIPEELKAEIPLNEYKDVIAPSEEQEESEEKGQLAKKIGGTALVNRDDMDISFYTFGIEAVEDQFGQEAADSVKGELLRIKAIEHETIGSLAGRGELSAQIRTVAHNLTARGVNADNLTPAEASSVYAYATNATPEIVQHKAARLVDNINTIIDRERKNNNQAELFNSKAKINDRYNAWERGEIDTSRGFDIEDAFEKAIENGYEGTRYLRRELEEGDIEELIEEGLVDESSLFVLGLPITQEELSGVQLYSSSKYTDITPSQIKGGHKKGRKTEYGRALKQKFEQLDPNDHSKEARAIRIAYDAWGKRHPSAGETERYGVNLSNLVGSSLKLATEQQNPESGKKTYTFEIIGNTVGAGPVNIEQDLLFDFVADEVLQSRRLRSKEMLMYATSLAIRVLDDIKKPEDEYKKVDYNNIRTAISYLGYYSAKILGFREEELRKRYGSNRPLKREFFEEIALSSRSMTDQRADYLDSLYKGPLTKMDEHIFNAVLGINALNSDNQFTGDEWD